ncbi:hypothetical protein GWK47_009439 [Chionoecetes opilio]|uniref:Uncharacterized protein n=1 Tax=Chionoecetes opilio TaxID=41210 RepID=A0A8J4XWY5_CHIOP|nr:hypothetical protein GWK47_009439 [Chionoecetes opilio]
MAPDKLSPLTVIRSRVITLRHVEEVIQGPLEHSSFIRAVRMPVSDVWTRGLVLATRTEELLLGGAESGGREHGPPQLKRTALSPLGWPRVWSYSRSVMEVNLRSTPLEGSLARCYLTFQGAIATMHAPVVEVIMHLW